MPFFYLDQLTVKYTAFPRFADLLEAGGGYRPSLRTSVSSSQAMLAGAYDRAQSRRGDKRRAFRY
ncbi:hypothetical protein [Desulfobulbus oligotrophicus]|uniref:Uncharacterized protein n=1 Tax=Desulfobulbus oligotrophicus TaxID=1909699 RepID=A0A7T6ARA2_9BACT|nr:hypothetical protein [Desulfobulbus oligotrophicus]QQG66337.1 hypothetical protein HP555_10900 [Desulfobulbus oligotrophicus]